MSTPNRPRQTSLWTTDERAASLKSSPRAVESITDSEEDAMCGVDDTPGPSRNFNARRSKKREDELGDEPAYAAQSPLLTPTTAHSHPEPIPLKGTDMVPPVKDGIMCICPARDTKTWTKLGVCPQCDVVMHYRCVARNAPDIKAFQCYWCPGSVLVNVPDRVARKVGARKPAVSSTKRVSKVSKQAPKRTTARASRAGQSAVGFEDALENPNNAIANEASPERHPPEQRLPTPDSISHQPIRTPQQDHDTVTHHFNTLFTSLLQHSNPAPPTPTQKDPRTTSLRKIFLQDLRIAPLWRTYCLLPPSRTTTAAVAMATKLGFVDGHFQPLHPAPEAWAQELKYRLASLLDAAAADGQKIRLEARLWECDAGMALRHVRDIALEVLHHGSFRRKRARLGVLGEVLGLSDKGAFWRGGDDFVGVGDGTQGRES